MWTVEASSGGYPLSQRSNKTFQPFPVAHLCENPPGRAGIGYRRGAPQARVVIRTTTCICTCFIHLCLASRRVDLLLRTHGLNNDQLHLAARTTNVGFIMYHIL